jgi:hypothetical protein
LATLEKTGFTLDGRVLCSDESCIGVVGPDGKCKVCNLEYQGDEPLTATGDDLRPSQSDELHQTVEAPVSKDVPAPGPGERVCCSDDACIGIVGPDGRCGTCGKPG